MAIADWFKENKEIVVSGMAFGTLLGLQISGTEGVFDESEWGIEADPVDDVFEEEDPFEFEEESGRI